MVTDINEILNKFNGVKKTRNGYTARCPSHDDSVNSISISIKDGKILMKCFAGCNINDIIDSIDIELTDLFLEKEDQEIMIATKKEEIKKYNSIDEILNTFKTLDDYYLYNKENEEPHVLQIRYLIGKSKSFATYYRDGEYWYAGKPNELIPLFNLDNIIKANSILIVEGEKLVKLLSKYGIVATTSIGGAMSAEGSDWSSLKNKASVVIWRDNDPPGEKYENTVYNILTDMGVIVRKVDVSALGLNEKDDIEQFINNTHGSVTDIRDRIISVIPKLITGKSTVNNLKNYLSKIYNGDINNLEIPGFPMLTEVGQFFIPGSITLIYSKPGKGKSLLTQNIFDDWVMNGKVKVKRLLLESSINMYLLRLLSKLTKTFDVLKTRFHYENPEISKQLVNQYSEYIDLCGATMTTSDSEMGKKITDWNEKSVLNWIANNIKGNDVLLIDPISRILGTGNAPIWEVTNRITAEVESLLSQNPHCRIVFVHHPNHEDNISGGSGWERFSHNIIEIVKTEEEELYEVMTVDGDILTTQLDRYIRIRKCRSGEGLDWKIGIRMSTHGLYFEEVGKIIKKAK